MAPDARNSLEALNVPVSADTALATLAEPVRAWFRARFANPTTGQRLAWPALAAGKNLFLCAPTGSGKTLAAFLPIVSGLLDQPMAATIRCLYVAPLKALGNDVRRSLRRHVADLRRFLPDGCSAPTVMLRTGDTSSHARRKLVLDPPDILLTTPESLAVMLTQATAADLFGGLRWMVVDEVHALVSNKRGADLTLSMERLEDLVGADVQRIGLSATCAPLATAAHFLVGTARPCAVAQVREGLPLDLRIEPLFVTSMREPNVLGRGFVALVLQRLEPELQRNRTTLIFTNVRSLAERLAWALRRRFPHWGEEIAVHHSALAGRVRRKVERQLKKGSLRAVISSTSLELGIDIGSVDGVVLVHPPGGVVRLLQRIGRSGHGPGRARRALILAATPAELLEVTVTAAAGRSDQVDWLRPVFAPLDVLCQQLLGMAAQRFWEPDQALALVRRAFVYRDLARNDFDACLDYLSGRHADGRSWLPPRIRWEGTRFTLQDERTARLLRRNLGTILTEEARCVRLVDDTPVGQVDEVFADRLQPGDRFVLDGRCFEFKRVENRALKVGETGGRPRVPRWAGEGWPLAADLARRLYLLRTLAAEALRDGPAALTALLRQDYGCDDAVVEALVPYFIRQERISEIPGPATCLVECVTDGDTCSCYVHTPLNRAGNDALARVAVLRLAREHGKSASSLVADLGFMLRVRLGYDLGPDEFRMLFAAQAFEANLTDALGASAILRDRFGRVAVTGLMMLRNPLGQRRRVGGQDWAERRLFDQVRAADPAFVLLRQAEREVREECCDVQAAKAYAEAFPRLTVRCRWLAEVSPFAENWTQVSAGPTESLESPVDALQRLHAILTAE
jgi:ATP-dependent Lhr-like helicase